MMLTVEGHRTAERRSLAYHGEIARRLVADPALVSRARAIVLARIAANEQGAREWLEVLDAPIANIVRSLTTDDERMAALRQTTPFLGILEPRTRWQLWRTVR
jgi:ABC-type Fe3+ transport system substrate-binding protein